MAQLGLRQLPLHPCPWQDCTQTFSSEAAAFDHAAHDMHEHAEPGEMCNFRGCGKKLSRDPASVRRHVKKHVSDKQFNCPAPGCNARFKEKSKLARHSIVHTKERPYVCQECRKGFQYSHNLHTHARVHTGVKPFRCTVPGCNKGFSQASNRNLHSQACGKPRQKKRKAADTGEPEPVGRKTLHVHEQTTLDWRAAPSLDLSNTSSLGELEHALEPLSDGLHEAKPSNPRTLLSPVTVLQPPALQLPEGGFLDLPPMMLVSWPTNGA